MYKYHDQKGEHLHTLDEKPLIGTSTVVSVLSKPLTYWAAGLAVAELGWTNSKEVPQDERIKIAEKRYAEIVMEMDGQPEKYLALLDKAYSAHSKSLKKSATKGTDMHADLETYVKTCIETGGSPHKLDDVLGLSKPVVEFSLWAKENIAKFLVSEGYCYSRELWVGGITDCVAELKNGQIAIIDFKSSKEAYDSQFIQIAGYDIEQAENGIFDANGGIVQKPKEIGAYIVIPFGAKEFKVEQRYNVASYKKGFEAACVLYKLTNIK